MRCQCSTLKGEQCTKTAVMGDLCSIHQKKCSNRMGSVQQPVQRPTAKQYTIHDIGVLPIENICEQLIRDGDYETLAHLIRSNTAFRVCQKILTDNKPDYKPLMDHLIVYIKHRNVSVVIEQHSPSGREYLRIRRWTDRGYYVDRYYNDVHDVSVVITQEDIYKLFDLGATIVLTYNAERPKFSWIIHITPKVRRYIVRYIVGGDGRTVLGCRLVKFLETNGYRSK
jgi:hypothetical protein